MTTDQVAAIIGGLLPLLISFVKREQFSNTVNGIIALIVYVVAGLLYAIASGTSFTADNIVTIIGIVAVSGTAAYTLFWSNIEDTKPTAPTA